jgi:hypothetical protein
MDNLIGIGNQIEAILWLGFAWKARRPIPLSIRKYRWYAIRLTTGGVARHVHLCWPGGGGGGGLARLIPLAEPDCDALCKSRRS